MRIIFLILFLIPTAVSAEDIQKTRLNWLTSTQGTLVGRIKESEGHDLLPIMESLGQIWLRKDGAVGAEVAPFIAEIMIKNPLLAFSWFAEHQESYEDFVIKSQQMLFTDYVVEAEIQIEMEYLRKRLALSAAEFSTNNPSKELKAMAKKLTKHVQRLKVRAID